jgi:hypothetical protein
MARIRTTLDYDQLRDADVIVEAVFESMDLKREVFAKLDAVARRGAVPRYQHFDLGYRGHRHCHLASGRRDRHALLLARERDAAARSGSHRAHIAGGHQNGHGAGQAAAQDAGARARLLLASSATA